MTTQRLAVPVREPETSLREQLLTLVEGRWLVLGTAVVVSLVGLFLAFIATPVYRSDVVLQVEERPRGQGGFGDVSQMMLEATPAETEIEIIKSRTLAGLVVDELGLDIMAGPRYFPIFGAALARRHRGPDLAWPVLGLPRFAWGGERITIERLRVPRSYQGAVLTLVARERGLFDLYGPRRELLLRGEVTRLASSEVDGQQLEIQVTDLRARPRTEFRIVKVPRNAAVEGLRGSLVVSERGRRTGILQVVLEGPDPRRIAATLDAIANTYLRQNVERKSEEAQKTLEFLNSQLPVLKANLDAAEAALNEYRSRKGSVDLSLETRGMLDRAADIEKAYSDLELQRSELQQRFTLSHPALIALQQKMASIRAERDALNAKLKSLPDAEMHSARLMRDVRVANELYMFLLNKSQELKVVKSGTIGNVRVVDSALVPTLPVRPDRRFAVLLSMGMGLALGVVLAFLRRALGHAVEDPEVIERETGLAVYAGIPHSERQAELVREASRPHGLRYPVLALADPTDVAVESLRSLRTSLQFALTEARNNVIAISGPSPRIGKSFVLVNLAHVLSDTGKKVLLIDGDMRKGRIHRYLGTERSPGLSEVISGAATFREVIRGGLFSPVHFVCMGHPPPNPSELLASTRFQNLLQAVEKDYDLVLIDTPPILAVTDSLIVARLAAVNLLVLRAGQHPLREIRLSVKQFRQGGVSHQGVIVNDIKRRAGAVYMYHYQYEYKSGSEKGRLGRWPTAQGPAA
jgi:tyrosine-protein kinase Etk/Wzc